MISLNEDLFDDVPDVAADVVLVDSQTEMPEIGPEMGIANILMQLIKDSYTMIDTYNSLYIALSDNQDYEAMDEVEKIVAEETTHIGALQALLQTFSPNMENIDAGEEIVDDSIPEWMEAI